MDTLQILDKVHAFYSDSFSDLLTLTMAVVGFSGIILPILIQIIQVRVSKVEQKSLQSQLSSEIGAARNELRTEISSLFLVDKEVLQARLSEELKKIDTRLDEQVSAARGATIFVQGVSLLEKGNHDAASECFARAARLFLQGRDELNAQRALTTLIDSCLPELTKDSFEGLASPEKEISNLLKLLQSRNDNGRFTDDIESISFLCKKGKTRTPSESGSS